MLAGPLPQHTVRLAFVGDVSAVANSRPPEVDPAIAAILRSADLVVANCETPLLRAPARRLSTRLGIRHAMSSDLLSGILDACGIDRGRLVLSLANNHIFDQGVAGFEETVAELAEMGILTAGTTGPLAVAEAGPLRVGLLAFTQWRNARPSAYAGRVTMRADIEDWQGPGAGHDLVCALAHWDREFRHFPASDTRALARKLVARGVSVVAGHHAHVLQPLETIDGALIAYGLGDFLGTALRRQPLPLRIGAVLVMDVAAEGAARGRPADYRLYPFLRTGRGDHERLAEIGSVGGRTGFRVRERLEKVLGDDWHDGAQTD